MADSTSPERLLTILEIFERERRPLALKEISDFCAIPMSTCHALVHTLLRRGYLYQTGQRKDLYPTRRLHDMGAVLLAHDSILQRLAPLLEILRERTQETVILGKRQRDAVLYLDVLEGPQTIRYSAQAGDVKPLYSSAIGKALLAGMADAEVRELVAKIRPARVTTNTITGAAALLRNLAEGRKLGHFVTRGENVPDVSAVAICLSVNRENFGIAVAGPSHRVDAQFPRIVKALRETEKNLRAQRIVDLPREAA